jgi:hypothetical protein
MATALESPSASNSRTGHSIYDIIVARLSVRQVAELQIDRFRKALDEGNREWMNRNVVFSDRKATDGDGEALINELLGLQHTALLLSKDSWQGQAGALLVEAMIGGLRNDRLVQWNVSIRVPSDGSQDVQKMTVEFGEPSGSVAADENPRRRVDALPSREN